MYRRSQNFRPPCPAVTITFALSGSLKIINNSELYISITQNNSHTNTLHHNLAQYPQQ